MGKAKLKLLRKLTTGRGSTVANSSTSALEAETSGEQGSAVAKAAAETAVETGKDAIIKKIAMSTIPKIAGKFYTPTALAGGAKDVYDLGKATVDTYNAWDHGKSHQEAATRYITKMNNKAKSIKQRRAAERFLLSKKYENIS